MFPSASLMSCVGWAAEVRRFVGLLGVANHSRFESRAAGLYREEYWGRSNHCPATIDQRSLNTRPPNTWSRPLWGILRRQLCDIDADQDKPVIAVRCPIGGERHATPINHRFIRRVHKAVGV